MYCWLFHVRLIIIYTFSQDPVKVQLVDNWYKRDDNAIPCVYVLQPISCQIPEYMTAKGMYSNNSYWLYKSQPIPLNS